MNKINGAMSQRIQTSENISIVKKDAKDMSSFSDPSFTKNRNCPIHRWVPWIAGFSKNFVNESINAYIPDGGIVLDPFAGVGTTLVESFITGNDCIGFEINPYAAFACNSKLDAINIDVEELTKCINDFKNFYENSLNSNYHPFSEYPKGFNSRVEFYSPKVLNKVLILNDFISRISDKKTLNLFQLAFSSTMVKYSNYSYEPSLGTRKGAKKPDVLDFDVGNLIILKLLEFVNDIQWVKDNSNGVIPKSKVYNDSFFNYASYLEKNSVDVIITSPPYLNNYHYNRNTRPQLYWLGMVSCPKDMKPIEESNFGQFWQTVRDQDEMHLAFDSSFIDLEDKLSLLRDINPDKRTYGGKGWANYAVKYFNDCYTFAEGIKYSLKSDGTALVVIGNSILQGIDIPTDYYFAKIAEAVGLELVEIHIPRGKRVGNSIIHSDVRSEKAKKSDRLYEAIVELRQF